MRLKIPGFGANIRRNLPPVFRQEGSIEDNWRRFFEWGLELRQPHIAIPEVPGAEVVVHPIGFTAVYLTQRAQGVRTPGIRGVVRANIIKPGIQLRDDIHSHGYNFVSGLVAGEVTNNRYDIDFNQSQPDGKGMIGYETRPDFFGVNHVRRVTDAVITVPPPQSQELATGDSYNMQRMDEFHSLMTDGGITIFGKEPAGVGGITTPIGDLSLILRRPDQLLPPAEY